MSKVFVAIAVQAPIVEEQPAWTKDKGFRNPVLKLKDQFLGSLSQRQQPEVGLVLKVAFPSIFLSL